MSFRPVFTDAGRVAAAIDNGKGLRTQISAVALGDAQYAIRDDAGVPADTATAATALQNEVLRLPVYAGGDPIPGQINVVAEVPAALPDEQQFFIGEIGFYDDNGVLIALWSDSTQNMGYRGDLMGWYLSLTLAWIDLPSDQFTVQVLNGPLSEQIIYTAQINAQIKVAVESAGMVYNRQDSSQLAAAIGDGSSADSMLALLSLVTADIKNKTHILQHESRLSQTDQLLYPLLNSNQNQTTTGNNNA